jgi:diguanylate cyclase (GGDEF)-like protein/PAS domain S-box-containing protein
MEYRARSPWRGLPLQWARLGGCFLASLLASAFVSFFSRGADGADGNLIWVANGVLLAYLLLAPRWRWHLYIAAGFAGQLLSALIIDGHFRPLSFFFIFLNLCEVSIAALLVRKCSQDLPRFTDLDYLLRFLGYAVVAAPAATGLVYALYAALWTRMAPATALFNWSISDGLGIAVTAPAIVAIIKTRWASTPLRHFWIYPALLAAVTVASFSQARIPLVFLIYPLLVLVLLRLGLGWSTLSLLFVSATSALLTLHGRGPFAALTASGNAEPGLLLQFFVAAGMIILYSVAVVLEKQKAAERRLQDIASLHKLVTENNRDVIILADLKGRRSYVSPSSELLGGWTPEELLLQGSLDLVHPLDLAKAEEALGEICKGLEEAHYELRIQKKDETYLWVEFSLRCIRDPRTGAPHGVLNIVRDISERKRAEQQLQEAYNAVEALAVTDGLTGIANRRRFDQYLTSEWRRSMREHQPLSLLMIDADLFKAYNDNYGHPRGDSCLKQIAEAAQDVVSRPGDLVARFGGEEFAVILPNTENAGAAKVAQEICDALSSRRLPHCGNPNGIMTISVGCGTMVPHLGQHAVNLIELADKALYEAKHNGRNRVCNGNQLEMAAMNGA